MEISNPQHQMMMSSHNIQLEELLGATSCPKLSTPPSDQHQKNNIDDNQGGGEKKPRPHPAEQALKCPRCESTNTKFCYYNNYSLTQPRYFCKGCRRYWTQGGTLRNVPVGGGCRKNHKRPSSSSSSSSANKNNIHKPSPQSLITTTTTTSTPPSNPNQSLLSSLSFDLPPPFLLGSPNPNPNPNPTGFLDILRSGFLDQYSAANLPASGYNSTSLYSYGVDGGLLPLDGVLQGLSSSATTTTTSTAAVAQSAMDEGHENKVMMGHQWQFGNNDTNVDYNWNGAGSYWHGVINSSLM